jgi:hypothetical protein
MGRTATTPVAEAIAWPAVLGLVTVAGSLAASCMTPFAALAVMVAATLPTGRAVSTLVAIWLVNQLIGFTVLGYPHSLPALASGLSLLAGGLAALLVATLAGVRSGSPPRLIVGFVLGFAVQELVIYAADLVIGGTETFAPRYMVPIALAEAVWFAILVGLSAGLQRLAPRLAPHAPVLRFA